MAPRVAHGLAAAVLIVASNGLTGCTTRSPSWVDEPVTFTAGGMTVYGTFRHPGGPGASVPGALLIAGSGPTDRDGNTALLPGTIDTLRNAAQALSEDGVASLRYDKLGSGQTGLGHYTADPATIGLSAFEDEVRAALGFLADRPGVDRARMMILGHSEGALFALRAAAAAPGTAPSVRALALVEPAAIRILDAVSQQARAQADAAVQAGQVTAAQAAESTAAIDRAIAAFRATGQVPSDVPPGLRPVINAVNAHALAQEDAIDPAAVAAELPSAMPVLVTCSDADIQVSCHDVDHLVSGLAAADAKTDYVHLAGVSHALKEDPSKTAGGYTEPLPFSSQFADALAAFVKANLA